MVLSLHTNDGKTIKLISIFSKIIYWLPVVKWADQWQMQKHNQNQKRVYFIGNKKLNTDAKKMLPFLCVHGFFFHSDIMMYLMYAISLYPSITMCWTPFLAFLSDFMTHKTFLKVWWTCWRVGSIWQKLFLIRYSLGKLN